MNNEVLARDLRKFVCEFVFRKELDGKTILITGGTGLIGSIIIRALSSLQDTAGVNVSIIATARSPQKVLDMEFPHGIDWVYQSMEQPLQLRARADYVIHTACPTQSAFLVNHPVEVINSSVTAARNVFEYAKEHGSTVVYLSSIEIYGQLFGMASVDETAYGTVDHMNVRSCYPESKKLIECLAVSYAKEYGTDIRIARLTQTFGAGIDRTDNRVFAQFARSVIASEDIVLHTAGQSAKSYIYTMDAIHALFYILIKGKKGEAYNVANEETFISVYDLAQFVVHHFNPNIQVRIEKRDMGYAPDTKVNLDTSKLKALGWSCQYGMYQMLDNLIQSLRGQ